LVEKRNRDQRLHGFLRLVVGRLPAQRPLAGRPLSIGAFASGEALSRDGGLSLFGRGRAADAERGAGPRGFRRLRDMRQLVRQELESLRVRRSVAAGPENKIWTGGKSDRVDGMGRAIGLIVRVDADRAEIGAEPALEIGADAGIKGSPAFPQRLMHNRRRRDVAAQHWPALAGEAP
jgi:hypothetical protein